MDKVTKIALVLALALLVMIIAIGTANKSLQKKRLPAARRKAPALSSGSKEMNRDKQESKPKVTKRKTRKTIYIPREKRVSPPATPPAMEGRDPEEFLNEDYYEKYYATEEFYPPE